MASAAMATMEDDLQHWLAPRRLTLWLLWMVTIFTADLSHASLRQTPVSQIWPSPNMTPSWLTNRYSNSWSPPPA